MWFPSLGDYSVWCSVDDSCFPISLHSCFMCFVQSKVFVRTRTRSWQIYSIIIPKEFKNILISGSIIEICLWPSRVTDLNKIMTHLQVKILFLMYIYLLVIIVFKFAAYKWRFNIILNCTNKCRWFLCKIFSANNGKRILNVDLLNNYIFLFCGWILLQVSYFYKWWALCFLPIISYITGKGIQNWVNSIYFYWFNKGKKKSVF